MEGSAAAKPQFLSQIYNVVFLTGRPRSHEAFELVRSPILDRGSLRNNMEEAEYILVPCFLFIYIYYVGYHCKITSTQPTC